jgi:hypothetical protein
MSKERLAQIEEKQRKKQQLSADENSFLAEWTRQLEAIEAKDMAKRAKQKKANEDMMQGIREQVR